MLHSHRTPIVLLLLAVLLAANGLFSTAASAQTTTTVCASGCDHTSINAAIDAASNGDVIQLAAEIYTEGVVIDTDGKAITIRGVVVDDEPASVIDGSGLHRVLQSTSGETGKTLLENLVIRNGRTPENTGFIEAGAGMRISQSGPTLVNCRFEENIAAEDPTVPFNDGGNGGGLSISQGSPSLVDCVFHANAAMSGGGVHVSGNESSPSFTNCEFTENLASLGGGLTCWGAEASLAGCTFDANRGYDQGGAILGNAAFITISDGRVIGNTAAGDSFSSGWGGGFSVTSGGELTISRTLIEGNLAASSGGAISGRGVFITISDGRVVGNTAGCCGGISSGRGGGFSITSGGEIAISRTLIAGNLAASSGIGGGQGGGIHLMSGSSAQLLECQIHDNVAASAGPWGAPGSGGGIRNSNSEVFLGETLAWCNEPEFEVGSYDDLGDNCIRNSCDPCPGADFDQDGVPDSDDLCPGFDDFFDADGDGIPDGCDICPGFDDGLDTDEDGAPDGCDGCPLDPDKVDPGTCGCGVADTPGSGVWDLDCDGDFDEDDIRLGMVEYGIVEAGDCPADLNGDSVVDGQDLAVVLGAWGLPCDS